MRHFGTPRLGATRILSSEISRPRRMNRNFVKSDYFWVLSNFGASFLQHGIQQNVSCCSSEMGRGRSAVRARARGGRSGEARNFWGPKPESRLLIKNAVDLPSFLGSPTDWLFGSQRTLVPGDLRVPSGDPGSGPPTDSKMG